MKHLFYVHSHTSYLTAVATIDYLRLNDEKIVILVSRNYKNIIDQRGYQEIDFSKIFELSMKKGEEFFFWKLKKLVKEVDEVLQLKVDSDFIAYLPHVGVFLPQAIATNKRCCGIRFVEEGTSSYSKSLQIRRLNFRETVKSLFSMIFTNYNRFWFTDFVFYHRFLERKKSVKTEVFGISDDSFALLHEYKRHVVSWPRITVNFSISAGFPIFVFEAGVEQKYISKDFYLKKVCDVVASESKPINYIKFHPGQAAENLDLILGYFKNNGCEAIVIPNEIPLELILSSDSKFKIVGFGSSLLFYAKKLNHEVISFEHLLMSDPLYIEYKKNVDFVI